jgi:hypothetical protein
MNRRWCGRPSAQVADTVFFAGSVKWLTSPVDDHDLAQLHAAASQVPGFGSGESGLVIVSRAAPERDLGRWRPDLIWGPENVINAWRP